jgi:Tubulin like
MANANHLVIGLAGTGGKIIRSLRRTIYQNYRAEQPKEVNIRYLYVDSSDEMMKHDDPSWKILGQSVQLPLSSQLLISGLNLGSVLDNISNFPGIAPWIGDRDAFGSC